MEKMDTTSRATCWSVTINNPTDCDEEQIALARQKGWRVIGQMEKGKEGTNHYQLMVKTPQVRFSAVKRAFPRGHIEAAKNEAALQQYVQKPETRVGSLPMKQEMYPSLQHFWQMVYDYWTRLEKDCLDANSLWEQGSVRWYNDKDDEQFDVDPMPWLDEAVRHMISGGYMVEGIACNPSTRTAWKKYARSILERCFKLNLAKPHDDESPETDSQTDSVEIPTQSI